jgi:glutamine amidotransferase
MRITLFDYGAGNLHSLAKALRGENRTVVLETDPRAALTTDVLVLPGVGAFAPAAARLAPARAAMRDAMRDGLPTLGICLGMQLMFDASDEGAGSGLGVFAGRVTKIDAAQLPQIGWNTLDAVTDRDVRAAALDTAYYANSYVCRPDDLTVVTAWSQHGNDRFPAAVRTARTLGVQFHPEKSSAPGVRLIQSFLESL